MCVLQQCKTCPPLDINVRGAYRVPSVLSVLRRAAAAPTLLLLVAVLCAGAVLVAHNHLGAGFRPDCAGCQHERTLGSSSTAVFVAADLAAPVPLERLPEPVATAIRDPLIARHASPRSPPLPA